ncbi:MAG: hypothetical protein ACLSUM_00800 [Dysosmobacter welbionis]
MEMIESYTNNGTPWRTRRRTIPSSMYGVYKVEALWWATSGLSWTNRLRLPL